MTVLIVPLPLRLIAKHLVRFRRLLEFFLGLFVVGISVGMVFHRGFSVRLLDLVWVCGPRYAQDLIVIAFYHRYFVPPPSGFPPCAAGGCASVESADTITLACRRTLSFSRYPLSTSSTTVWGGTSVLGTCSSASCMCGSNGLPTTSIGRTPWVSRIFRNLV